MRIQTAIVSCCLAFFSFTGFGEDLPKQIQQQIDSMIYAELDNHAFPGAAFICGNADTILYARNYGFLDYSHNIPVRTIMARQVMGSVKLYCRKSPAWHACVLRLYVVGL